MAMWKNQRIITIDSVYATNGRGQASEPQVSVKSQTLKHVGKIDGQRLGNLQDYIQICAKKW